MVRLRNALFGRAAWRFATASPEMDVSVEPSAARLKLHGLMERGRWLRDFSQRHRLLLRALLLTLIWELIAEAVGLLGALVFPSTPDISAFLQRHPAFRHEQFPLWESIWARWDGVWYMLIATHGYGPSVGILHAFFPAFPGLIHVVGVLFGGDYLLAGVLINRVLLFPAVAIFTQIVREESGDQAAENAPLFFLLVPMAVFFLAIYTETLFLLACLACFLAMRHQKWWLAGLCCAVATATRLPGMVLAGAVLVEGLASRKYRQGLGAAALGLGGLAAYALYGLFAYHDALAFQHAYNYGWSGRHFTLNILEGPLHYFQLLFSSWPWNVSYLSYVLALLIDCVLLAVMWRPMRWSYRVFVIGSMVLPLMSGTLFAYNRYSLVLFPFLLVACRWTAKRPGLREATLLVMGFFCVLNLLMFTASYWVG